MRWSATVAAFLTAIGLLVGCHASSPVEDTTTPARPSSTNHSNGATTTAPPDPGGLGLDEASRSEALELAETAMGLYARPDVAYEVWWADLQPMLSAGACAAYVTVDPARIPVRQVTGPAELPEWTTPEVARVSVPTDVGSYLVVLARSDVDPVWRVERFVPPEVLS